MNESTQRDEIVELFTRYGWACDTKDWTLLESCFYPDATIDYSGFGHAIEGYQPLEDYLRQALDALDATQHLFTNFAVEIAGDECTFRCGMRAQHVRRSATDGPLFEVAGTYHVAARRSEDGWRMTELRYTPIWMSGNPNVLAHIMEDTDATLPGRPQTV